MKRFHVIAGGTMQHIDSHLALCSPAYGSVGRLIYEELKHQCRTDAGANLHLHVTSMAEHKATASIWGDNADATRFVTLMNQEMFGGRRPESNEDVRFLVDRLVAREDTKIIFLAAALCDFKPKNLGQNNPLEYREEFGKEQPRLSSDRAAYLVMEPADKIISSVRQTRKDVFLVGFKQTAGDDPDIMYSKGLRLLKQSSANLVLANDRETKLNMVITPEESKYHETTDRQEAIRGLVEMALLRSHLSFTRSTVVDGEPVPWSSWEVPENLRAVVNHLIERGAYKPVLGKTAGHFAVRLGLTTFLTSRRKQNFNDLDKVGLVRVETDGPDSVIAYGSRPSVGGQSQRIVFTDHPGYDCIAHAHIPLKSGAEKDVPVVSQREYECGSHECGQNTSKGLRVLGNGILGVHLDNHGPNLVFRRNVPAEEVIEVLEKFWDVTGKTGGRLVSGVV